MHNFSLAHINVRSLIKNYPGFLQHVEGKDFDAIAVSESWLSDQVLDQVVALKGYQLVRRDRSGRVGGGVAIFINNRYSFKRIEHLRTGSSEQLWVSVRMQGTKFAVGVIYRPGDYPLNQFASEFEDTLADLITTHSQILCCGDFNVNFLNTTDSSTAKIDNILEGFDLRQVVADATHDKTLIDLMIVPKDLDIHKCTVIPAPEVADHDLVLLELSPNTNLKEPVFKTIRDFKNINNDAFLGDLLNMPFENIYYAESIDRKVQLLTSYLATLFDLHAPFKTIKITKPPAPWLTDNVKSLMKLRDRAALKYKKSRLTAHLNYYKELRNFTKSAIDREKKAYLKSRSDRCDHGPFWKRLRELGICRSSNMNDLPAGLNSANDINKHFVSASITPDPVDGRLIDFFGGNKLENVRLLRFNYTSEDEILKGLLTIKSGAIGVDGISIKMILYCCPYILPTLVHIFNYCFEKGVYPSLWKTAYIVPVGKVSRPATFADLRPISILAVLSKVFERIIFNQLKKHCDLHHVLPDNQSGFRSGYSCSTALLDVCDDIFRAVDENDLTALVLLDYTKAFDRINHQLLLAMLHFVGLEHESFELMKNYLEHRRQMVRLRDTTSDIVEVNCGVPQGSVLGPLLFAIYTSQFKKQLQYCRSHFYADDTQLYYSFKPSEIETACTHINSDLSALVKISRDSCLSINPYKSKVMLFGRLPTRNRCVSRFKLAVDGEPLELVRVCRNLGLEIDDSLKFDNHVNKIVKRAFGNLKLLYSYKNCLDKNSRTILCESLVLSHLNFADVVYGPSLTNYNYNRLQRIQNSCVRFIFGLRKFDHISDKYEDLRWLKARDRMLLHSCCLYHKIILTKTPPYLYNKINFRTDIHNINIRFRNTITVPQHRTKLFQGSFSYNVAKLYNSVPKEYKQLSMNSFKFKFKEYIFQQSILCLNR